MTVVEGGDQPAERVWGHANGALGERGLLRQHIIASIAHARMLGRQGILAAADARRLMRGLAELLESPPESSEMSGDGGLPGAVAAGLAQMLGADLTSQLEVGRGRADQFLTDLRLWTREAILDSADASVDLRKALVDAAERQGEQLMPGYSHLQRSQPILLAHHLIAYVEMFYRDGNRLRENYVRADILPLGAGDGAGVPYPVDRAYVAELLGMHTTTRNSLDAVGDGDFLLEHLASLAIIATHLSRLAEELVLWSSEEFGFIDPGEPDGEGRPVERAEQVRGRTGQVYGALMAMLTTVKGLPLGASRDLRIDTAPYFEAVGAIQQGLELCTSLIANARWRTESLGRAANAPGLAARAVGDFDVRGGTAPSRVLAAVQESHGRIDGLRVWIAERRAKLPIVERLLAD